MVVFGKSRTAAATLRPSAQEAEMDRELPTVTYDFPFVLQAVLQQQKFSFKLRAAEVSMRRIFGVENATLKHTMILLAKPGDSQVFTSRLRAC